MSFLCVRFFIRNNGCGPKSQKHLARTCKHARMSFMHASMCFNCFRAVLQWSEVYSGRRSVTGLWWGEQRDIFFTFLRGMRGLGLFDILDPKRQLTVGASHTFSTGNFWLIWWKPRARIFLVGVYISHRKNSGWFIFSKNFLFGGNFAPATFSFALFIKECFDISAWWKPSNPQRSDWTIVLLWIDVSDWWRVCLGYTNVSTRNVTLVKQGGVTCFSVHVFFVWDDSQSGSFGNYITGDMGSFNNILL